MYHVALSTMRCYLIFKEAVWMLNHVLLKLEALNSAVSGVSPPPGSFPNDLTQNCCQINLAASLNRWAQTQTADDILGLAVQL